MKSKETKHEKQGNGSLQEKLAAVLTKYQPYFAGNFANLNQQNLSKLEQLLSNTSGIATAFESTSNKQFLGLLNQLDGLGYGDKAMAMPKWVALDCGFLPSGFVGFAQPVGECSLETLAKFDIEKGYTGLVPVSEFCCIPAAQKNMWIGHTLASIANGENLGLLSKILGLALFGVKNYKGVAQWDNTSIMTHTKIADLDINPCVPLHSEPIKSFVYTHAVTPDMDQLLKKFVVPPKKKEPNDYFSTASFYNEGNDKIKSHTYKTVDANGIQGVGEKSCVSLKDIQRLHDKEHTWTILYPGMIWEYFDPKSESLKRYEHSVVPLQHYSDGGSSQR